MAQFSVKKNIIDSAINAEGKLANELSSLENEIRSVSGSLGFKLAANANIRNRLNSTANKVSAHRVSANRLRSALQDTVNAYDRSENTIIGNLNVKDAMMQNTPGLGYIGSGFGEGILHWLQDFLNKSMVRPDEGKYRDYVIKRIAEILGFLTSTLNGNSHLTAADLVFGLPAFIQGNMDAFDAFVGDIKDTLLKETGFDVDAKVSGSLFDKQLSCENGSLGLTIGAYEAYASAEGGLFSKDKDGNAFFNPHIDAKMGASFTAFEAAGAYAVGDDWLGAGASGNITAGKVSAEASASASLFKEDGTFDPHAKIDASAEAILVDAKAKAGVTVLGTKADVEASVNVGIGAHANVEFGDGKISCDIGASLGIGASLSFTIDYGGTVDAVKKAAKGMAESVLSKLKFW